MQTSTSNEIIELDPNTGEINLPVQSDSFDTIKQVKLKASNVISHNDFVKINGRYEPTKDGLTKILSSLPISYSWKILSDEVLSLDGGAYAKVKGVLSIHIGETVRDIEGMGVVERNEFSSGMKYSLHNMLAKAETRALKRAIDVAFGSIINWFVKTQLETQPTTQRQ
ncbi:hypothetical protein FJR45_00345 [Sulfurimonas sediminis]|uniref:Uncharacterized protein n=1 Tax=Sulfurimonas sediminis TaxID=2590020 RepID=A0A7M1AYP7_9BACT|nr:hypothetical protein [Sulfurimonas sediminis]QOP42485.1 hypothetical protein FJR45_00345 [Sulfurimonas sediminis]